MPHHALPLFALVSMLVLVACSGPSNSATGSSPTEETLWAEETGNSLLVHVGDELFTEFLYGHDPRPILFPLLSPSGVPVTRSYPMREVPEEAPDHPHHRSLWFAHGDVNGVDFWHEGAERPGRIVDNGWRENVVVRDDTLRIGFGFDWNDPQGNTLLTEQRRMLFGATEDERWIDFEIALTASDEDVTFGDTKEGTFAMRMHPELRLVGDVAKGSAVNSTGVTGKDVWGKRAAWVHYQGSVSGKPVGVAMFEHPSNFRHPTWWHAREYGLVAANPFGVHDFERKPAGTGDHVLAASETLTLRYRVWIHAGTRTPQEVAEAFTLYRAQTSDL
ncbi:MAG: PmoA family protein [Planctomycetota bacterium]